MTRNETETKKLLDTHEIITVTAKSSMNRENCVTPDVEIFQETKQLVRLESSAGNTQFSFLHFKTLELKVPIFAKRWQ